MSRWTGVYLVTRAGVAVISESTVMASEPCEEERTEASERTGPTRAPCQGVSRLARVVPSEVSEPAHARRVPSTRSEPS